MNRKKTRKKSKTLSRRRKAEQQQRSLLIGSGLVAVAVVLLLGYGWLMQSRTLREPVAEVTLDNGDTVTITRKPFHARVRFERSRYRKQAFSDARYIEPLHDVYGFGQMILERMALEVLLREAAAEQGLDVTEAEIEAYIMEAYGEGEGAGVPWATATLPPDFTGPTPTPEPVDPQREYRVDRRTWRTYGLTDAALDDLVRARLIELQLQSLFGETDFAAWREAARDRITWLDGWDTNLPDQPTINLDELEEQP